MPQTPDDESTSALDRLRAAPEDELRRGVGQVEGITPEEAEARNRKGKSDVSDTLHRAVRWSVWFGLFLGAVIAVTLTFSTVFLTIKYLQFVASTPDRIEFILGEIVKFIVYAGTALFADGVRRKWASDR